MTGCKTRMTAIYDQQNDMPELLVLFVVDWDRVVRFTNLVDACQRIPITEINTHDVSKWVVSYTKVIQMERCSYGDRF